MSNIVVSNISHSQPACCQAFGIFKNFVSKKLKNLIETIKAIFLKIFCKEAPFRYSGEVIKTGPGLKTIKELLVEKMDVTDLTSSNEYKVPGYFKADLLRTDQFKINGSYVFVHPKINEKHPDLSIAYKAMHKAAGNEIKAYSLMKLLHQGTIADLAFHLTKRLQSQIKNTSLFPMENKGMIFELTTNKKIVELTVGCVLNVRLFNEQANKLSPLGILALKRVVDIPLNEIRDYTDCKDLEQVVPNLKVTDTYSPLFRSSIKVSKAFKNIGILSAKTKS